MWWPVDADADADGFAQKVENPRRERARDVEKAQETPRQRIAVASGVQRGLSRETFCEEEFFVREDWVYEG